jgi:hypothetical protein
MRLVLDRADEMDWAGARSMAMGEVRSRGRWSAKARRRRFYVMLVVVGVTVGGCRVSHGEGGPDHSRLGRHISAGSASALRRLVAKVPCPPVGRVMAASRADLAAFDPVAAVTCEETDRTYPGDGRWLVSVHRASWSGVTALQRAFERQDRFDRHVKACLDVLVVGPPVLFVDRRGHYLVARYPREHPCTRPLQSTLRSVERHRWTVVSTTRIRQQATAVEVTAGCDAHGKNMLTIDVGSGIRPSPGGPVFTHDHARLKACIYRVSVNSAEVDNFVRGVRFDARQSASLRAALTGPGRTSSSCPSERTFAWISNRDGTEGFQIPIELGGCWRLERGDGTLGSASNPATLRQLLEQ